MNFKNNPLLSSARKKIASGIAKRVEVKKLKKNKEDKENKEIKYFTVWEAFKCEDGLSSQEVFLNMDHISEVLYTGSRYIGKSDAGIMAFVKHVGKGYGARWRGVILRTEFSVLADLIKKAKAIILAAFPKGSENPARWLSSMSKYHFEWKTGEVLMFRGLKTADDYINKAHGQELPFIFFDEITAWPDDTVYNLMRSCCRCGKVDGKETPPFIMRAACNPSGPGKRWVRDYFIAPADFGTVIVDSFEEEGVTYLKKRMAVKGNWRENPHADISYIIASIYPYKKTNPPLFYEWCEGDWYQTAGTIFSSVWNPLIHKLKSFEIPPSWTIWCSYDDGFHDPYSCLFFAASDGIVPAIIDGFKFLPQKGSVIVIDEIYGADKNNRNKGLFQQTAQIARIIKNKMNELLSTICINHKEFEIGKTEWKMFAISDEKNNATIMEENGVILERCLKINKNSIENKMIIISNMILASINNDNNCNHLYFTDRCNVLMDNLINLSYDKSIEFTISNQVDCDFECLVYGLK